ncbi:MAG TPA: acetylglutamate kinase [bacterium]|nr:acetylglutamate kinase [bacterium]
MKNDSHLKAQILIEAFPYIRKWYGATVVVKYGGSTRSGAEELKTTLQDVVLMKFVGMKPVVVHGGGKDISRITEKLGIRSQFVDGLRVTDLPTMEVVEMVLGGKINKELVSVIHQLGGQAVGLSGKDGGLLQASKVKSKSGRDIGFVGKVSRVNTSLLDILDREQFIPVIAPLGMGPGGQTYNVNADEAAGAIAGALKAEKLVFLTDVPGICRKKEDPRSLISTLKAKEVPGLIKKGIVSGGMIPKVEACLAAIRQGVRKTHIIDGTQAHALLLEIFTPSGVGTEIIP